MSKRQCEWLLTAVSLAWGSSYIFMKAGLADLPPLAVVAWRSGLAFLLLIVIFWRRCRRASGQTLVASAITGSLLAGVFWGLLYGVRYTSASEAAFLTNTTVLIVPLIQCILHKHWPQRRQVVSLVMVLAGLYILAGSFKQLNIGAIWSLIAATLYALQIIATNAFVRRVDALALGVYQLGFAAFGAAIMSAIFEPWVLPTQSGQWGALIGLAVICSAFGFTAQSYAQKFTTPETTSLFFSLEPVFTLLLAVPFLHEEVTPIKLGGCALIFIGIMVTNLPSQHLRTKKIVP